MMKFYSYHVDWLGECVEEYESESGRWATRADAEQVEKERDEFQRKGTELRFLYGEALINLEQATKDAVELARLVIDHSTSTSKMLKQAQDIIDRYEGVKP